jgi:hypothetical protein
MEYYYGQLTLKANLEYGVTVVHLSASFNAFGVSKVMAGLLCVLCAKHGWDIVLIDSWF